MGCQDRSKISIESYLTVKFLPIILYLLTTLFSLRAQPISAFMHEGARMEAEFKIDEALQAYELVLQSHPNHLQALIHASRMLSNQAGHAENPGNRKRELNRAESYSRRAIGVDPASADAHFSLIVTLGLQAESATNPREKIKDARIIREEAEIIVDLDSTYALAYFVLGKWHHELSKLNWFERAACELFFGGLPEGVSMDKAVLYFQQALRLEPDSILFLYGQAIALHYDGMDSEAIRLLNKALALPIRDPDDSIRKGKCVALLKELQ